MCNFIVTFYLYNLFRIRCVYFFTPTELLLFLCVCMSPINSCSLQVMIFFSAHGVPLAYVEEAGDPYKAEMEECVELIMEELETRKITNACTLAYQVSTFCLFLQLILHEFWFLQLSLLRFCIKMLLYSPHQPSHKESSLGESFHN